GPARRQRHPGPADHVRGHGELAATGGPGARRCARVDGVDRGEVAGMNAAAAGDVAAWNRLEWSALDAGARARALTRPVQAVAEPTVVSGGCRTGEAAKSMLIARLDGVDPHRWEVVAAGFAAAEAAVAPELRQAMVEAMQRIEAFPRAGMSQGYAVDTAPGVR